MIDACLGSAGSVYSALQRHICEALCGLSLHEKNSAGLFIKQERSIAGRCPAGTGASVCATAS